MIKVSVIIPVYNTELYLRQCIDTVINQTLKEIEIILINNGSTDASGKILEEYKNLDDRIIVINNKENVTAGEARNQGLEIAKGEYLSFLDSDDYFELDMLENIYTVCKENNSDVGTFNAKAFDNETGKELWDLKPPYFFRKAGEKFVFRPKEYKNCLFTLFSPCAWNKIFKTEFIRRLELKFQEISSVNDAYFSIVSMYMANNIAYIDDSYVFYRKNHSTAITSQKGNRLDCFCDMIIAIKESILHYNKTVDFGKTFFDFFSKWIRPHLSGIENERLIFFLELLKNHKTFFESILVENIIFDKSAITLYNNIFNIGIDNSSFMDDMYSSNLERILDLLDSSKNIALWGAGKYGQKFIEATSEKINIKYIIDNDVEKQGKYINHIRITSFNEVEKSIDTIIVTNENYYEDILNQVSKINENVKVIDINSFCRYNTY